jgi:hypothetical protein
VVDGTPCVGVSNAMLSLADVDLVRQIVPAGPGGELIDETLGVVADVGVVQFSPAGIAEGTLRIRVASVLGHAPSRAVRYSLGADGRRGDRRPHAPSTGAGALQSTSLRHVCVTAPPALCLHPES